MNYECQILLFSALFTNYTRAHTEVLSEHNSNLNQINYGLTTVFVYYLFIHFECRVFDWDL